jgi:glycerol uptake facilitator-like aquaporin
MEVPGGKDNKISVCLHEAFGTMLLLLAINWGAASGNVAEAVCVTIFVAFVLTANASGAHLNPAVTLGVTVLYGSVEQWIFPI